MMTTTEEFMKFWELGLGCARSPAKYTTQMIGFAARNDIMLTTNEKALMNKFVKARGKHLGRNANGIGGNNISYQPFAFFISNQNYDGCCLLCETSLYQAPIFRTYDDNGQFNHFCYDCGLGKFGRDYILKNLKEPKFFRGYEKKHNRQLPDLATALLAVGDK